VAGLVRGDVTRSAVRNGQPRENPGPAWWGKFRKWGKSGERVGNCKLLYLLIYFYLFPISPLPHLLFHFPKIFHLFFSLGWHLDQRAKKTV
jgi:hypothetical protein